MKAGIGANPAVVITGGARGIGYGLAKAFLARGASVVISGRALASVDAAVAALEADSRAKGDAAGNKGKILGAACDVRDYDSVRRLWDFSEGAFGKVDIWINNAGLGQPQTDIEGLDTSLIKDIFATNCAGALFGSKVALMGMKKRGSGAIYNMEGLGSKGGLIRGMTAYGASKRALAYITDSLAKEAAGTGLIVGALMPGMTVTDLITKEYEGKPEEWAKVRKIFNILSDTVDTIAPWLVDRMLKNRRNGARIVWLTGGKAAWRFLSSPFVKRSPYPASMG
jgi:NAD(P)-dependent dehydrogenase (short-subunit alcohol dehydrogenase family)